MLQPTINDPLPPHQQQITAVSSSSSSSEKKPSSLSSSSRVLEDIEHGLPHHSSTAAASDMSPFQRFRSKLSHFFHTPTASYIVITLVLLDMLLLSAEMIIQQHFCQAASSSVLHPEGDDHEEAEPPAVKVASHIIGWTSFTILCLMGLELILHMVASGPRKFCSQRGHLVDMFVVFSAIALDLLSKSSVSNVIMQLLVIVRLWRIVRLVHASSDLAMRKLKEVVAEDKETIRLYERKVAHLQERLSVTMQQQQQQRGSSTSIKLPLSVYNSKK